MCWGGDDTFCDVFIVCQTVTTTGDNASLLFAAVHFTHTSGASGRGPSTFLDCGLLLKISHTQVC